MTGPHRTREELLAEVETLRTALGQDRHSSETTDSLRVEIGDGALGEAVPLRYRDLVEHGTNMFYAHTPEGVLVYVSPQVEHFLGCAAEEAKVRWTEFATDHPINAKGIAHTERAVQTGERQPPYELHLKKRTGEIIWVEVHEAPVVKNGVVLGVIGALSDISGRKRAERLHRVERRLGQDLGAARDLETALMAVRDAALRITDVDAAGLYVLSEDGEHYDLRTHLGFPPEFVEKVGHIGTGEAPGRLLRRASGSHIEVRTGPVVTAGFRSGIAFPLRFEGRILGSLNVASRGSASLPGIVRSSLRTMADLAAAVLSRFHVEDSLAVSEATLRAVVGAAQAGIGLTRNRVVQWVNDEMLRMTGHDIGGVVGHDARLFYGDDAEYERIGRLLHEGIPQDGAVAVETVWVQQDGSPFAVHLSASALDPRDLSKGVVFTAWDLTDRKRSEEERHLLEAQFQHAQKLESLGILAGGIAHDFNNILHTILGNADMAARSVTSRDAAYANLSEIQKAAARAGELCHQMLAYSGRGSFVVRNVDLGGLVRDIAGMLEVSLSKKATLTIEVDDGLHAVRADPGQMRQVIMNLITNAAEAVGDRPGTVRVVIENREFDAADVAVFAPEWSLEPGRYVRCRIEDSGSGMDVHALSRVFEPFFTTKFTGRGLGMAAVQGIVRGHEGAIRIESEPGLGTVVVVVLPALDAPTDDEPVVRRSETWWGRQGLVLIVDDEEPVRALGEAILRDVGLDVLTAADGAEAVRIFQKRADEVACVVLDLTMPVMDGEEAFHALRALRPDVPVVLCSGYSTQELESRFETEMPTSFLQKPFTPDELRATLASVLDA